MPLKTASANRKDINTAANGVTLEHRHFCFIASVVASLAELQAVKSNRFLLADDVSNAFANACAHTNPKFNRARFLAACNVGA